MWCWRWGWTALLKYVAEGFGVGLLPRSVAAAAGPGLAVRPLDPAVAPVNRVRLIARPTPEGGLDLSEDGRAFAAALREAVPATMPAG